MKKPPVEMRYYLVHQNKKNITYEATLAKWMKSLTEYAEGYGKDGFLSERLLPENVMKRAISKAKAEHHDNQECDYSLEKAIIHTDETGKEERATIESQTNFAHWVKPDDINLTFVSKGA
jgi:hypothetical protein